METIKNIQVDGITYAIEDEEVRTKLNTTSLGENVNIGNQVQIADNTKITHADNLFCDIHVGVEDSDFQTGYLNFRTSLTGMGTKISDCVMINSGFAVSFTDDNKIVFTNIKTGMKAELPLSY